MAFDCEGAAEIWRESFHIARKEHKCCECRMPILPGEKYAYIFILYEGDTSVFKQHLCCWSMARHVNLDIIGEELTKEITGYSFCAYHFGEVRQFFWEDPANPERVGQSSYWGMAPFKNFTDEQYYALRKVWLEIVAGGRRDWRRPGENPDDNLHGYLKESA